MEQTMQSPSFAMSTGTDVRAALRRKIALNTAQLEAYLSTHAFEILFLGLYVAANIFIFIMGAHDQFHDTKTKFPHLPQFKWYIAIARGGGYTLNLNCGIILILASRLFMTSIRETSLHKILPLDKSFPKAHIIVGYFILGGVLIHVPFHFVWIFKYDMLDPFTWWSFSMTFALGIPLFSIFISMFATAVPWVRRKFFRIFYIIHIAGASLFFPLLLLHGMKNKVPETYKYILPGMILYALDRIWRRYKISSADLQLSGAHSALKAGKVLELRVPKPFNYRAGQYAEISVPFLSKEWHPFTIASAPYEDSMTFYIKSNGDWTSKLYAAFEERISDTSSSSLQIRIRGPFGAPAESFPAYKKICLISGGIGATPFASIAKELHRRSTLITCEYPDAYPKDLGSPCENMEASQRISMTVGKLYDLQVDGKPVDRAVKQQYAKHVSGTLRMNSPRSIVKTLSGNIARTLSLNKPVPTDLNIQRISSSSSSYDSTTACSTFAGENEKNHVTLDLEDNCSSPRHFPQLRHYGARTLSFLHTTRIALCLLFSLVLRFSLVCIVAIWKIGKFGFTGSTIESTGMWALCSDSGLAVFLFIVMAFTIFLEISFLRSKFFSNPIRCLDFFIFLPVSMVALILSVQSCIKPDIIRGAFTALHFSIYLPIVFLLLSYRMYRSVGSKTLYGPRRKCGCSCGKHVPDVDFVWTTPQKSDDQWLRDELKPLAAGSQLRLHRYVTREKEVSDDEEHIYSSAGRPDWEQLFENIAETTPSNEEVGVFFCGPPRMGAAIRRALRDIEVRSNLRGSYLAALTDDDVARDFAAKNLHDVQGLRRYGCGKYAPSVKYA